MKVGETNYKKVAEIDGQIIFADKDGYFIWEHYPVNNNGEYCAVPVMLGKTAKEVNASLGDLLDWNYRAWHGEMKAVLKAKELVKKLPSIGGNL